MQGSHALSKYAFGIVFAIGMALVLSLFTFIGAMFDVMESRDDDVREIQFRTTEQSASIRENIAALNQTISAQQIENETLSATIDELQAQVSMLSATIDRQRMDIMSFESIVNSLDRRIDEQEGEIIALQEQLRTHKR